MSNNDLKLVSCESDRKGNIYPVDSLKEFNNEDIKRRLEALRGDNDSKKIELDEYGLPEIGLSYIEVARPDLLDPQFDVFLNEINTEFELLVDEYDTKNSNEVERSNKVENKTTKKELYPYKELREIAKSMGVNLDDI